MLCQFQTINLKAEDVTSIDDEELPAIDPFAGGAGSTNQVTETDNSQMNSNSGLLNNMRLVGTVIGENKNTAAFPIHEYWLDIGSVDDYQHANGNIVR